MSCNIEITYEDLEAKIVSAKSIKSTLEKGCIDLGLTKNYEIEIMWALKKKIQDLNREFRNIDAPTDVLSFPQTKSPNQEINLLGSIVLNLDKIKEKNENPLDVILHGLLHLAGFDHETDESEWNEAAKKIGCGL